MEIEDIYNNHVRNWENGPQTDTQTQMIDWKSETSFPERRAEEEAPGGVSAGDEALASPLVSGKVNPFRGIKRCISLSFSLDPISRSVSSREAMADCE